MIYCPYWKNLISMQPKPRNKPAAAKLIGVLLEDQGSLAAL